MLHLRRMSTIRSGNEDLTTPTVRIAPISVSNSSVPGLRHVQEYLPVRETINDVVPTMAAIIDDAAQMLLTHGLRKGHMASGVVVHLEFERFAT